MDKYKKPNDLKGKLVEKIMIGLLEVPREKRHAKAVMIYETLEEFEKILSEGAMPKHTLCKCRKEFEVYNKLEGTMVCTLCGTSRLA